MYSPPPQLIVDGSITEGLFRARISPKAGNLETVTNSNSFKPLKYSPPKRKSITGVLGTLPCNIYVFLVIICLGIFFVFQLAAYIFLSQNESANIQLTDIEDIIQKEASVFKSEDESESSGHTFELGINTIQPCVFDTPLPHMFNNQILSRAPMIDENTYYSHHVNIKHDSWVYGQVCIMPHEHEHVLELYLSASNGATGEDHILTRNTAAKSDYDCDLYISARDTFPTKVDWDFRSNNIGNDHIKIPLYLDDFKNSKGALVFGIYGKNDADQGNKCTFTVKINTFANEELLHKFNLRRGQVLLPRDVGLKLNKKSPSSPQSS